MDMDRMRIDVAHLIAKHRAAGDESPTLLNEYYRLVEASINDAVDEIAAKPAAHRVGLLESLIACDLVRLPAAMRAVKITWIVKTALIPQERLLIKIKSASEALGIVLDEVGDKSKIKELHNSLARRNHV